MVNPSTITRLSVLLLFFHQICGIVISVPEEMVPENLTVRDPDSESGFSINQDVLSQLLKNVYSSSIVKRQGMIDNQAECRDCENGEDERQDDQEAYEEETMHHHQPDKYNNHPQNAKQMYRYSTSTEENVYLKDQRTQDHKPHCEYVDSEKESFSSPYPPKAPQTVYQWNNEHKANSPRHQSVGVEYQTVSDQYPFTEFSPRSYDQLKKRKSLSSKQYFIQDSSPGLQQRYEEQQSTRTIRPGNQKNMHQPTQNFHYVQQQAHRGPPAADYRDDDSHPCGTHEERRSSQASSQQPPRLQIDNVSVRRRSLS